MTTQRELGLDQLLESVNVQLLEARDLVLSEGLVSQVSERRAAPQRQRLFEQRLRPLGAARRELATTHGDATLEAQ